MSSYFYSRFITIHRCSLLATVIFLPAISACQPSSLFTMKQKTVITANGAVPSDIPLNVFEGDGPVYAHRKSKPEHTYELTMSIENAPGLFEFVRGRVTVQAKNDACAPVQPISGVQIAPRVILPLEIKKISDTEYRCVFHADPLLNEAYWKNHPPCEWEFTAVGVLLKATGADEETGFNHALWSDELDKGLPIKHHFWNGFYRESSMKGFSTSGNKDIEVFKPEFRNDLFSITLSATKVRP